MDNRAVPRVLPARTVALALILSCVVAAPRPTVAELPELTLQTGGSAVGGEDGDGSDLRWATLRMSWGLDRLQLRGELSWLDFDGEGIAAAPPGLGPIAPSRRGHGSASGENVSGNGNGLESGSGAVIGTIEELAPEPASTPSEARGLGDLRLGASYRVAGGGARVYRIDLGASVKLPTAEEETALGTGELDWRVGVSAEYRFWSLTAFGGLGYNGLGDQRDLVIEDVVDVHAGIESLPLADRFLLAGWLEGNPEVFVGQGSRIAAGGSVRTLGQVRFELQARAGLTDAAEDFSVSIAVSFGFRPPVAGPAGVRR